MTNEQIIFNAQIELLNEGKIGVDSNGNLEEIHTFQRWKAKGYRVRKGAKAIIALQIWKVAAKKKQGTNSSDDDTDDDEIKYFLKKAFFFSASQVIPA